MESVPRGYVIDKLHQLGPYFWHRDDLADTIIKVVPLGRPHALHSAAAARRPASGVTTRQEHRVFAGAPGQGPGVGVGVGAGNGAEDMSAHSRRTWHPTPTPYRGRYDDLASGAFVPAPPQTTPRDDDGMASIRSWISDTTASIYSTQSDPRRSLLLGDQGLPTQESGVHIYHLHRDYLIAQSAFFAKLLARPSTPPYDDEEEEHGEATGQGQGQGQGQEQEQDEIVPDPSSPAHSPQWHKRHAPIREDTIDSLMPAFGEPDDLGETERVHSSGDLPGPGPGPTRAQRSTRRQERQVQVTMTIALPSPRDFPPVLEWMYFGNPLLTLIRPIERGEATWSGLARNIDFLGLCNSAKIALGKYWRSVHDESRPLTPSMAGVGAGGGGLPWTPILPGDRFLRTRLPEDESEDDTGGRLVRVKREDLARRGRGRYDMI